MRANREADSQANREADRQTERQKDRRANRQAGRLTGRHTDRQADLRLLRCRGLRIVLEDTGTADNVVVFVGTRVPAGRSDGKNGGSQNSRSASGAWVASSEQIHMENSARCVLPKLVHLKAQSTQTHAVNIMAWRVYHL